MDATEPTQTSTPQVYSYVAENLRPNTDYEVSVAAVSKNISSPGKLTMKFSTSKFMLPILESWSIPIADPSVCILLVSGGLSWLLTLGYIVTAGPPFEILRMKSQCSPLISSQLGSPHRMGIRTVFWPDTSFSQLFSFARSWNRH